MDTLERALFCLEQGFELQFRLGPTLQGREVRVYTNYPTNGYKFNRLQFHPLDWVYPNSQKDDCDKYCRLDLTVAGSYQYYFSCGDKEKVSGGYIVVDPVLRVGASNDILPLDRISSQTYLAKGLGPVDTWLSRIRVAKETGYNMIHFTPLQRLGSSGLCYSISDHLELNPAFSAGAKSCTWEDIGRLVETLRRDWNMICISDVVYDHTAADGAWILLHPECGYNLVNSPELRPAWLLDRALWHFSCQMADGTFSKQGLPALIQDERHMTALRGVLWQQVFSRLSLWEFGQVNVDEAVDQFRQALQKGAVSIRPPAGSTELKTLQDPQCRRFGRTVDLGSAVLAFSPLSSKPADIEESCCRLRKKLEELNWEEYRKMSLCTEQVLDSVLDQVRSERLAVDGPRLAVVSRERPLCPRYFTFPFGELSLAEEKQLLQTETAGRVLAYDTFLRGDPLRRSAEPDPEKLLRRQLEVRGNDVKLRYGETPEDCPQLWARMRAYAELTARVFSGVCVVDCSSTPLHVTEAMLAAARALRPNFYVMAELQAGSQLTDSVFVNRLGITSVVRGVADRHSEEDWLSCFGKEPIGAFVQPSLRPLTPAAAHSMFKDIIPDYSRPMKDCSVYNIMVDSTLGSMACCATGSTRGYDELLLHQDSGRREAVHYACWSSDCPQREPHPPGNRDPGCQTGSEHPAPARGRTDEDATASPAGPPLIYAGLQGLMSVMAEIRPHNDLHHPFCLNLRRGDWILDYTVSRLLAKGGPVAEVGLWFEAMFGYLKRLPRDLVPSYFDAIVQGAYTTALNAVFSRMSSFVQTGSSLVKQLALGSVQMCGPGHSWTQLNLSPGLKVELQSCVSLAA
ncbi:glycogen debranching enzyme-like, partial [Salarias fasciatus]|uniref:glycogen debranching enzyme-like n=1 Tax=Salarias fasciatus TaxID=181472 RepID=UPI00117658B3